MSVPLPCVCACLYQRHPTRHGRSWSDPELPSSSPWAGWPYCGCQSTLPSSEQWSSQPWPTETKVKLTPVKETSVFKLNSRTWFCVSLRFFSDRVKSRSMLAHWCLVSCKSWLHCWNFVLSRVSSSCNAFTPDSKVAIFSARLACWNQSKVRIERALWLA